MRPLLSISLLWFSLVGCLPADVCDPGQIPDEGNLCEPNAADAGLPDAGFSTDGGQDGGLSDGG